MPDLIATNNWLGLLTYTTITLIISGVTYFISRNKDVRINKNSFRQQWIDNARNTLSQYCSLLIKVSGTHSIGAAYKNEPDRADYLQQVDFHYYKLLLLFNSNSKTNNHDKIRVKLTTINDLIRKDSGSLNEEDRKELKLEIENLILLVQHDLINEWQKVKKGD